MNTCTLVHTTLLYIFLLYIHLSVHYIHLHSLNILTFYCTHTFFTLHLFIYHCIFRYLFILNPYCMHQYITNKHTFNCVVDSIRIVDCFVKPRNKCLCGRNSDRLLLFIPTNFTVRPARVISVQTSNLRGNFL